MAHGPYFATNNDWYNCKVSAFGQWFVALPRAYYTAYDASHDPVPGTWIDRSPHKGGTPAHLAYDAAAQAQCDALAAYLNANHAI